MVNWMYIPCALNAYDTQEAGQLAGFHSLAFICLAIGSSLGFTFEGKVNEVLALEP